MARMPASIEAEARAAVGWLGGVGGSWAHLGRNHETTAETTAAAPTEEHMSLTTALHEALAEAEAIGEELLGHAKVIAANPATAPSLQWLSTLAGLNIDPTIITKGLGAIEALHIAYQPLAQQQAQAAAEAQAAEAPAQ